MFQDRTAGFKATYARQPDDAELYAQLHRRKRELVTEGETLLKSAGPNGELATAKLQRIESITAELDAVSSQLAQVEHDREQLKRRILAGTAGPGLAVPADGLQLKLGQIGLARAPLSAAQLFGSGSMDGWSNAGEFLKAIA